MQGKSAENAPGPKKGTATRRRGQIQVRNILREARALLINDGFAGLTVRKVARNLGISLGNLTYYFPNKTELLRAVITDMLADYHEALLVEQRRFPDDPHGRFLAYLEFLIEDCKKPETRAFFFQIWGIATHNEIVHDLRNEIYAAFRADATELITPLRQASPPTEIRSVVTAFISLIEGLHVTFDISSSVFDLAPGFEAEFRDMAYLLVTRGPDAEVRREINKHLHESRRRF